MISALFDSMVLDLAAKLKSLAREANERAAALRAEQRYEDAETMDRRAESLRCAAALAETRGMQA